MQELDDKALLREYVERDSGEAFAALVTRHVPKVYSVENDLEHPPQRHVRKKLESFVRTNRLYLEWIALGCTAKLFLDRLAHGPVPP